MDEMNLTANPLEYECAANLSLKHNWIGSHTFSLIKDRWKSLVEFHFKRQGIKDFTNPEQ